MAGSFQNRIDLTNLWQQTLEESWNTKLGQVNTRLFYADSLEKYRAVLKDLNKWTSFSFFLRRYIYLSFTGRSKDEPPVAFESQIPIKGRIPRFSPVLAAQDLSEHELDDYAAVLYALTVQNKCLVEKKNGELSTDGLIQKREYLKYLKGDAVIESRERLLTLSVALQFSPEDMEDCANILGMIPYNWRSPEDIFFYYAHLRYAQKKDFSMMKIRGLIRRYDNLCHDPGVVKIPSARNRATAEIQYGIDNILNSRRSFAEEEEQQRALLEFLVSNQHYFNASRYSETAYQLFMELYETAREVSVKTRTVSEGKLGEKKYEERYRSLLHPEERDKVQGIIRIFDSMFAINSVDALDDQNSPVFSELRRNRINADRLTKLLNKQIPVSKKDIVFLFFYTRTRTTDVMNMSERERRLFIDGFQQELDDYLIEAGQPPLYAANRFDNLILTALASANPFLFFEDVFRNLDKVDVDENGIPQWDIDVLERTDRGYCNTCEE